MNSTHTSESIAILSPLGCDAELAAEVFVREGMSPVICESFDHLLRDVDERIQDLKILLRQGDAVFLGCVAQHKERNRPDFRWRE